ncbi:MAG: hypothetical protein ACR2KX_15980 [Chitinophagaceae bacterium]
MALLIVKSGFSLDEEKGILFAGTGSASFDFYGGKEQVIIYLRIVFLALRRQYVYNILYYPRFHIRLAGKAFTPFSNFLIFIRC